MISFSQLFDKVQTTDRVWVRLHDGLKLCLVAVENEEDQTFIAKFLPCASNARKYLIRYNEIKKLEDTEIAGGNQ